MAEIKEIISLNIETSNCNFKLFLNDIEIFHHRSGTPLYFILPINEWLKVLENKIKLEVIKSDDEPYLNSDTTASITVTKRMESESKLNANKIAEFVLPLIENPKTEIEQKLFATLSGSFISPIESNSTIFSDLQDISKIHSSEVYNFYLKLFDVFKAKDFNVFLNLIDFKITEFSKSYGKSKDSEIIRQKEFYERFYNTDYFILAQERVHTKFVLPGKVLLMEDEVGDQPIYFYDRPNKLILSYPVYLAKKNGEKELSIIR
ncbi:MAG: hypothetical protein ACK5P4_12055 [Bacteroidota bacterium]|jgi:hypothetical protein